MRTGQLLINNFAEQLTSNRNANMLCATCPDRSSTTEFGSMMYAKETGRNTCLTNLILCFTLDHHSSTKK